MEVTSVTKTEENIKPRKKLKTLNSYTGKLKVLEGFSWILLVLYMVPFYLMFINSLKSRREIFSNTTSLPAEWNFSNYSQAINKMDMLKSFGNSLIITVGAVLLILLCSSMAAWVLVRDKSIKSKI